MCRIIGGFAKKDGLKGGTNHGCSFWEQGSTCTRHVPNTKHDLPPLSIPIDLEEDTSDVGDTTHVILFAMLADTPIGPRRGEISMPMQDLSRTISCKKP